ncbi:MAG: ParB/RepB/Spo0J family partition protein [Terriglobales bacterium]
MKRRIVMQNAQNTAISNEYRSVPISILVESATNPRKRFDEQNLEELAASMKVQGILAPLLVRELEESKYEVVAGARRLRAAKLAELETVPVRVVKLTDAESIEAQVVENLQREDIHPLEESLGFKSLLQLGEPTYTIASIAARAGKSEAYVQGRIKLADLIPTVAEAFLKDTIAIGHALLIAKLPDSQQQEAFNAAFRGMWTTDGNSQVLIPVRELALCRAPHKANNAESAVMRTPHHGMLGWRHGMAPLLRIIMGAFSKAMSLSVALKRPVRSFGAIAASRVSSFTVGSARV